MFDPSIHKPGFAVGPYLTTRSGAYVHEVYLKADDIQSTDVVAFFEHTVLSDKGLQLRERRAIKGIDFQQPNAYQAFDLEFDYDGLDPVAARLFFTGKARIWLGGLALTRQSHDRQAEPDLTASTASLGDGLELQGYAIQPQSLLPGTTARGTLLLRQVRPLGEQVRFSVQLADATGNLVARNDDLPFDTGEGPQSFRQRFLLYVPELVEVGKYDLYLGLSSKATQARVPIREAPGQPVLDRLHLGSIRVSNHPRLRPSPAVPLGTLVGDAFELRGYTLLQRATDDGPDLQVKLYWRSREAVSADYTVFVHLIDSQGKLARQHDSQPRLGSYPTSSWGVGDEIVDEHVVKLGADLPPGLYRLQVGMYLLPAVVRLPTKTDSIPESDHVVLVDRLTVP